MLYEVKTVMSPKLQQEGFSLTIDINELPPFLYDRDVLIQVLVNLIENSIKFGSRASQKDISISAQHDDKRVCIQVSDTGPGIPRGESKKIFEEFLFEILKNLFNIVQGIRSFRMS